MYPDVPEEPQFCSRRVDPITVAECFSSVAYLISCFHRLVFCHHTEYGRILSANA
jgi:hypothetical protein